jgi:CDP-paratose 2-epimerase
MKVLVTGGCGFLGSHICEHFNNLGWQVIAYDNMTKFETSRIDFGNQEKIRNYNYNFLDKLGVSIIVADICDKKELKNSVIASNCDIIINCAAQPTMTLSSEKPVFDFETNVVGTINLLELARQYNIPLALCSSIHVYGTGINDNLEETDEVYHRRPPLISEEHPVLTGQLTPLHASKRCAEIYGRMYTEAYLTRVATFRLTGIYGARQFGSEEHGWVSLLAIKTMLGLPIQLIGNGKQVRDILYVTDAVEAFDKWIKAGCPSGIYNIGGGVQNIISVKQCLKQLSRLFNKEQIITDGGVRRGDLLYFACDTKRAFNHFNWEAKIPPTTGLKHLAGWLRECKDIFNA